MCLESYGLDAVHYYSAPGMAWDSALKMTAVKLQLFDNEDMYTFIERSIRGGVSQISKRYAKANNSRCKNYNPLKPITHLVYLDANNLYGWAMSQPLATHGFRWLTEEEITTIEIQSLADAAEDGYIFEVDLSYPSHLHDKHNDYPLAPERLTIDQSMLSNLQQQFPKHQKKTTQKLSPNLRDKVKYVVHYRNLKFYLKQGMVITKIHRVLTFKQSPWLKSFIDFNTKMRAVATSDFAKDFFKLMNNSVFGKTQENLRNRINVEVITKKEIALKRVCKPTFKRSQALREDLVVVQTAITNLKLCKPIYIGFSVLDLSKLLMYTYHYDKMLTKYNDIQLCFTDTDSLLYEIKTDDLYTDMLQDHEQFDFSGYSKDHPIFNGLDESKIEDMKKKNKKVVGKFKDELDGEVLEEFLGLRPKCYSILFGCHEKQTAKGTKESVKKACLRHTHYKETHTNLSTISIKQNVIKSKSHTIATYHQTKISLTAFDTKRWICDDNIKTYAYGHFKTREEYYINWDEPMDIDDENINF